jgi:hypothetical protein
MSQVDVDTREHFHKIATRFDDLYENESRGVLERQIDN